jgi:hypothetical protein
MKTIYVVIRETQHTDVLEARRGYFTSRAKAEALVESLNKSPNAIGYGFQYTVQEIERSVQ